MAKSARERKFKPRVMTTAFLVFCEGQTEEAYLNMLRQNYRLPIKIIAKTTGQKISQNTIHRNKNKYGGLAKVFLMYDGDVEEILEKLQSFNETLLISCPCIELWFYSHYNVPDDTPITSKKCVEKLKSIHCWNNYEKATLSPIQADELWKKRLEAVSNMERCKDNKNNYSMIDEFIKILEKEKKGTHNA